MYNEILHTPAGAIKFLELDQFIEIIPIEIISGNHIVIPYTDSKSQSVSYFGEDDYSLSSQSSVIKAKDVKLDFTGSYSSNNYSNSDIAQKQFIYESIRLELFPLVAKKVPNYFVKDLSLDSIQKLSQDYIKATAKYGDLYGIHIILSPYQKFFALTHINNFKFFLNIELDEAKTINSPMSMTNYINYIFYGKLVEFNPEHWLIIRWEELTYRKEAANMMRYEPPTLF